MKIQPLESPHMVAHALNYARRGLKVFPCHEPFESVCSCGNPDCDSAGKHPRTAHGFSEATTDKNQIRIWWEQWPNANIGLPCGDKFFAFDIDPKNGGNESLAKLESERGNLPKTVTANTGGGGNHFLFSVNDTPVNGRIGILPGIDVKSTGGYIIAPPSRHASGKLYQWSPESVPKFAEAPEWLVDLINGGNGEKKPPFDTAYAFGNPDQGTRYRTLVSLIGKCLHAGMPEQTTLLAARDACKDWAPPVEDQVIRNTVFRMYRKYEPAIKSNLDLLAHLNNDHGNAERLIAAYGDVLRYCHPMRKWVAWDGRRWAVDANKQAYKLAKSAMLEYVQQAHKAGIEAHEKYSRQSLDSKRINALLESAQCEIFIEPEKLDTHSYLLNCNNGVVDLRNGELLPHDPALYLTKLVRLDFDPDATCSAWKNFLYRIMGNEIDLDRSDRLVFWLQKALGYSLTSITREKAVFVCYGPTDTGKSTFLSTFRSIVEEYSALLQIDTLMIKRIGETNASLADLADLRGCRFVQTSETEKGQRLAEGKLKRISQGMGKIKTCRKYENPIEFSETHKLWIDANHKPRVSGNDGATWNRLYPIPFIVQIPKEEQDRDLPTKLLAEAEGILAWAIQGAIRWYAEGLGKAKEIEAANREWRDDEDTQGKFIAECLEAGESDTESGRVYEIYSWWCLKNGEKPENGTTFGRGMTERGFERGNAVSTRRTVYRKIAVIAAIQNDFDADQHHKKGTSTLF